MTVIDSVSALRSRSMGISTRIDSCRAVPASSAYRAEKFDNGNIEDVGAVLSGHHHRCRQIPRPTIRMKRYLLRRSDDLRSSASTQSVSRFADAHFVYLNICIPRRVNPPNTHLIVCGIPVLTSPL
jgi:hypothetical protein